MNELRDQLMALLQTLSAQCRPFDEQADAVLAVVQTERDQLRYERRLLGFARIVLDRVAHGNRADWFDSERISAEAEDIAQRIVDEIGHPVTDEPALGPSFRVEIDQLKVAIERVRRLCHLTINASCRVQAIEQAEDTLAALDQPAETSQGGPQWTTTSQNKET